MTKQQKSKIKKEKRAAEEVDRILLDALRKIRNADPKGNV